MTATIELMLPYNDWFGVAYPQISYVVVSQMAMIAFIPSPAEQFCLSEVSYLSHTYFSIHCGAPLFVGLQVDQPYFLIIIVTYHNLFRTDHFDSNKPIIFNFHFLPKQGLSVAVSVKKKYRMLSKILNVLLSSLLLHQKHECVVEGSEHIVNICVFLSKVDWNRFLVKHLIQSIK